MTDCGCVTQALLASQAKMKKLIPPEQQKAMKAYMMEKIAEYDTAGPEGLPEPDGLCHELPDEVYSTQS